MKFFEGFPKVKDYTSSRIFFRLPPMLGYILNLSPSLELCPFSSFWGFHLIFLWPMSLDCFELKFFSFALSLLGVPFDLIGPWLCHLID